MKKGFTLSEMLITIAILGVVISLTIPNVIGNDNLDENVIKVKKIYKELDGAMKRMKADNGGDLVGVITTCVEETTTQLGRSECLLEELSKYMKFNKVCGGELGCAHDGILYHLNGAVSHSNLDTLTPNAAKAILLDGTSLHVNLNTATVCNQTSGELTELCGFFSFDISGLEAPSKRGYDFFNIWITKDGVLPRGAGDAYSCDANDSTDSRGIGCAAYILRKGVIDY